MGEGCSRLQTLLLERLSLNFKCAILTIKLAEKINDAQVMSGHDSVIISLLETLYDGVLGKIAFLTWVKS